LIGDYLTGISSSSSLIALSIDPGTVLAGDAFIGEIEPAAFIGTSCSSSSVYESSLLNFSRL
jgi:hypothetical protein